MEELNEDPSKWINAKRLLISLRSMKKSFALKGRESSLSRTVRGGKCSVGFGRRKSL